MYRYLHICTRKCRKDEPEIGYAHGLVGKRVRRKMLIEMRK